MKLTYPEYNRLSDAVPMQRVLWQRRILPGITESACPGTVRGRYTVEGTDWMPRLDEVALSLAWRFLNELVIPGGRDKCEQ